LFVSGTIDHCSLRWERLIKLKILLTIIIFLIVFFLTFNTGVSSAEKIKLPTPDSTASVLEVQITLPKPTVEDLIVKYSKQYGVSTVTALRVAKCESGYDPYAKNQNSSATGVFQFISGTWLSVVKMRGQEYTLEDRKDAEKNIDNALWLAAKEGWGHWECK
jgi:soluble lytic murein transglycosylase-like protein